MKRIIVLVTFGTLCLGGWAWAQQEEMLKHSADVQMEEMDSASCPASSSSSGGG
jgi:hypothetical protein